MSRDPLRVWDDQPGEIQRRLFELSNLYSVARSLLGARDHDRVASRVVLSAMGSLGARSGVMFVLDERGRLRLRYAYGPDPEQVEYGETLAVPAETREWMLRQGVFKVDSAVLGPLRGRLSERYDSAIGASIADTHGLAAVLLLGPRPLTEAYGDDDLSLLDSLAGLAALALGSRVSGERSVAPAPPRERRPRTLDALRASHPPLRALVGQSQALLEACQDLVAVARTRFPVLLTGESGSGKEVAARAIHEMSDRSSGPFEVVDCGSIPRELIESELFGHVRGAFTGAHRDRRGAFELAHRGTLFLDEIGEMPLQLQTRLLRVLQEGRFRRVGDEQPIEGDVRVVAATNRALRADVDARRFREDLYYRLNVFAVHLPPLRERPEDIPLLVRHFLAHQGRDAGIRDWSVDEDVLAALTSYAWPGNVRELANLCAALAVQALGTGHIVLDDLERVWRRQHGDAERPWHGAARAPRGHLGSWVLEHARGARFNLIEASRQLQRRKRAGQAPPITERSALTYYVTGEILRALVESNGDVEAAARSVAEDPELVARVAPRVRKVVEMLRAGRGDDQVCRRFSKLPADYQDTLERARRLVTVR